jgi:2-(1,2-epoxy-1,2-dihydrophenyl)acetyl-CoA isomerase
MADARVIDTGTEECLARLDDGVATVTLNRPERRNALSHAMLEGLARALESCEASREVRAVVLTGAGRAFCAGGDVKSMAEAGDPTPGGGPATFDEAVHRQRLSQRATVGRIYRMPKPVIGCIPGAAAGAGFGLAMACDLRIAGEGAVFVTAFARVGFTGDYGLPWLLPQAVGRAKALELFYNSDRVTAQEALALGIVNRVVPDAELERETIALARKLATGPAVSFRYIKENANKACSQDLEDFMDGEVMRHLTAGRTEDHREAVKAFVDKREPTFKGR